MLQFGMLYWVCNGRTVIVPQTLAAAEELVRMVHKDLGHFAAPYIIKAQLRRAWFPRMVLTKADVLS